MNKFINFVTLSCIPFPLFIPLFMVFENVDSFYNIYTHYIKSYFCTDGAPHSCDVANWTSIVTRFLLCFFGFAEGSRTQMTILTVFFLWLEMQSRYQFLLLRKLNSQEFFRWYNKVRIALSIVEHVLSSWIQTLMMAFFFVIVVANVATIRFITVLPLKVFWFVPACSFLYSSSLSLLFPHIMGCNEQTDFILQKCRQEILHNCRTSSLSVKVTLKILRSLRPISLKCGSSFILKRNTKSTFYDTIVQRTVDGILLE